jgi:nucleotide-binding universal stress UspA family protein
MFKNILVPFDGSKYAEKALLYAVNLAKEYGAKITVIHVATKKVYPLAETAVVIDTEKEGQEILKNSESQARALGVTAEYVLVTGNPADEILKYATNKKIDLIAMGSRGLSDIKAFFLGSVSKKISQRAECPVLIVK